MSKRKSPAEKDALAKEVTRLSNQWVEANKGNPEFQPGHYATKKNPFGDKEKANVAFGKALKKIETDLCKERGLVYSKYQDGEYMLEAPKSLMELYGKGVGGHRGVAHPKTKKQIHDYFQQWYKKNRKSVLRRMAKQRLAGGAVDVQRMSDFFQPESAPPPPPPPNPKRKRDPVPYEAPKKKRGRFPSLVQLRGLYEEIRPRFNNRDEAGANAELDAFIAEFELTDELRMEWHQEDPELEDLFGNIFQLVAGGDELLDAGYVAPVNVFGLDSGEMDEALEGDEEGAGYKGGANGDDDEGETDTEMDTDDEDEVNPLALPHFWDGQQWVPIVPNPPPANLFEDDEIIEGAGYYRMSNGCALYTGGSLMPINYNSELKDNSWYPMGYSGGARVMPINHSSELKSSFGTF
jgi:hypothetical protein